MQKRVTRLFILLAILTIRLSATCAIDIETRLPEPVFANPPGALTTGPLSVTLTSTSTQQIYFTTNGEQPWLSSQIYDVNTPLYIDQDTVIKAFAYCGPEFPPSVISTFNFNFFTPPLGISADFTNSAGIQFILVPPMKTSEEPFYVSKYEITQSQWQSLMVTNPSRTLNSEGPVEQINWNDTQAFIQRLNELEGTSRYSLPSKLEWTYVATAGTRDRYHFGNENSLLRFFAWYGYNANCSTNGDARCSQTRGGRLPNSWGFYDFYGNVREWVQDDYQQNLSYRFSMNCSYSNNSTRACFTQSFSLNPNSFSSPNLGFRIKAKVLNQSYQSPFLQDSEYKQPPIKLFDE
ncbi:MAG: SUMF1/EgtB/PvdO family nonheme iron enzyme [bacterium]|nr:SUMF1/EgtB/PvdO family nonheme iron enzyme [bacterium]